jgi:hypothetical protein
MEETALVDFIRFLCVSFRTQGASSLSKPKSSMDNPVSPVTIKIKQHESERAEGVKGAIADFVLFHCPLSPPRGETPATKRAISENTAFYPRSNQRPCSAHLAEPFPP